jgi:para-nitrobenzyl esterase
MTNFLNRNTLRALPLALAGFAVGCADVEESEAIGDAESSLQTAESAASGATTAPTVTVKQGKLQGTLANNSTRVFLGVPYAKAPVGALRFAPPVPAPAWSGTRAATAFGPICPQLPGGLSAPGTQSEDCLSLNVYSPKRANKLPVLVFIHGGAFIAGGATSYDGVRLSEEANAIVVTFNYRLGALGLLSHPNLDAQRGNAPSGNDAFRDQQLALQWVKDNAAAFGGDAANVTLFGESAGAMSTCIQLVSPLSRTLAKRFVMESGTCVAGLAINSKPQAQAIGTELANAFCSGATDVVSCLRAVPAEQLIAWGADRGISGAGWAPVWNPADPLLPQHPKALIAAGNYNKGNIIVGSNAREWGLFQAIGASPVIPSVAALAAAIDQQFGPIAPYVKGQYVTGQTDATANDAFVRLFTDYLFRCPARALARQTTARGTSAFLYHFEEGAAFHAFELPYVFGNPNPRLGATTLAEPLREYIQNGFGAFARSGVPNQSWPRYTLAADQHISLKNPTPTVGANLSKADCDFWDYIGSLTGA